MSHRYKQGGYMSRKVLAAIVYAASALAIANWLDYAFFAWQVYGYKVPLLLWVALAGCVCLLLSCILAFFSYRYGLFIALIGLCLAWPYSGALAWNLHWDRFIWFVRFQDHGPSQVIAVFMLAALTAYSIVRLRSSARTFASA
jgi:hypothetical protein